MVRLLSADIERWPVAGSFNIARGAKTHVDVVTVRIGDGHYQGWGEATPIYYHGETAEGCLAQLRALGDHAIEDRQALASLLPRGAARNALDCAIWDLEAQASSTPVWQLAGLPTPQPVITAFTISLNSPDQMRADAAAAVARGFPLLKCKLTGQGDAERVAAVRVGAPDARLIVDANESWHGLDITHEAARMKDLGVEMVEQPIRHGEEGALHGVSAPLPFCADESCQDRADMPALADFDAINIKLDKAGGLTEGLALARMGREQGKDLMVGCMLSTSLGIAPAFLLAPMARWVDLDGALLLAQDRPGGLALRDGWLHPGDLWGVPR